MENKNQALVQSILNAMQVEIKKHGLDLMQTYPNDLLVHDKSNLEMFAVAGAKIAWNAGHCHTHIVNLGLHGEENENVEYLTHLSSSDHFYSITVNRDGETFAMKEVDREGFVALNNTAVPFERQGGKSEFWLLHQKSRVGHIVVESVGTINEPKMSATITPVAGITALERAALSMWCSKAATETAQSLFTPFTVTWNDAVSDRLAA